MKVIYFVLALSIAIFGCKSKQKATTAATTPQTVTAKDLPKAPEKEQQMQAENTEPDTELYNIETEMLPMLKKYGVTSWREVAIALEKTPCYGRCPSYRLAILADGRVFYQGGRNVDNIGDFLCTLEKSKVNALQQKLADLDYFNLKAKYDMGATDLPSTHFYMNQKGKSKAIEARQGAPIALRDFATEIEEIIGACGLKKAEVGATD